MLGHEAAFVRRNLHLLDDEGREVLILRLGLDRPEGDSPRTLAHVGAIIGASREDVRRREAKAFSRLRHPASGAR